MVAREVNNDAVWLEEQEDDDDVKDTIARSLKSSRWDSLNPKVKERIVNAGQGRAIANKKKREGALTKKRRKYRQAVMVYSYCTVCQPFSQTRYLS